MFELLSTYGITPSILQIIIVAGFAVFLIGMFWRFILIGTGILFCVYVFAIPNIKREDVVKEPQVKPVKEILGEMPKEYLEDCMLYTGKDEAGCRDLWNDRNNDQ